MGKKQKQKLTNLIQKAQKSLSERLSFEPEAPVEVNLKLTAKLPEIKKSTEHLVPVKLLETKEWAEMKPFDLNDEAKKDLLVIQNRHVLDPKRHYKRMDKISKTFQIGRIISSGQDSLGKLTRKEKGNSIVEELLQDQKTKTYLRKKELEIAAKRNFVTRKGFKRKNKK